MRLAPVIVPADRIPDEILLEADDASHRAGDMLMRSSGLATSLRRTTSFGPDLLPSLRDLAAEGRAFAAGIERIAARIAALQARATS